ncbi:MAG: DUF4097 family beta strand repeat-containing protein [Bacteroidota bacterium]
MKKILLTMGLLIVAVSLSIAQEYKLSKSTGKLVVREVDRVNFEGTTGNEIIFMTESHNDRRPERAKGLVPINGSGVMDNTDIGLSVKDKGGEVVVQQVSSNSKTRYTIKVPKGVSIYYEHTTYHGKDINFKDVQSEIEVSAHYNGINLKNVTGPMAIKSVYGHVEADFASLNQNGSVSLYSVYDFVDVSLPASARANVSMKSGYGEMFTDMKLDMGTTGDMVKVSSKQVQGTLNGGGVDLSLKSSYKNIYLRKRKQQ